MASSLMFKFDRVVRVGYPPMPKDDRRGLPTMSILDPLFKLLEHRAQSRREPPNGFGSIILPRRVVVDEEFLVRATFPPSPFDDSDSLQSGWLKDAKLACKNSFPVEMEIEATKAFDVPKPQLALNLGSIRRVVALNFLVRAVIPGHHYLRLRLKYPQQVEDVEFTFAVRVRSKITDKLQKVGMAAGLVATILTIMKLAHVF